MATLTLAICARNAQDIIGECLKSIRDQTLPPDEVVVVVDELSDPTTAVAEGYGARIIASNATGLYEARNAVLDACETDYLAFTDADCVLCSEWIERAKAVLDQHADVAAGTGKHPPIGERNFAGWLHHMWFLVETRETGETDGVIGGNSYFRTSALRDVGGWLNLPGHSAAEDVYVSMALRNAGWRIWFDEGVAAHHHYETRLKGLWKKAVMMGKDIVVMHRAAGWRGGLWWYTLAIPVLAGAVLAGLIMSPLSPILGAVLVAGPLIATLLYLTVSFGSVTKAVPRWVARWFLIWPYAWGIVQGLIAPVPAEARR